MLDMAHAVACADAALLLRLYSTHALASQAQPAVVQARSRASGAHTHSHTHAHTHTHTGAQGHRHTEGIQLISC